MDSTNTHKKGFTGPKRKTKPKGSLEPCSRASPPISLIVKAQEYIAKIDDEVAELKTHSRAIIETEQPLAKDRDRLHPCGPRVAEVLTWQSPYHSKSRAVPQPRFERHKSKTILKSGRP